MNWEIIYANVLGNGELFWLRIRPFLNSQSFTNACLMLLQIDNKVEQWQKEALSGFTRSNLDKGPNPLSIWHQDVPDSCCTSLFRILPGDNGHQEAVFGSKIVYFLYLDSHRPTSFRESFLPVPYACDSLAVAWGLDPEPWLKSSKPLNPSFQFWMLFALPLYMPAPLRVTWSWTQASSTLSLTHTVLLIVASSMVCLKAKVKSLPEADVNVQSIILYTWPTWVTSGEKSFKNNNCLLGEIWNSEPEHFF